MYQVTITDNSQQRALLTNSLTAATLCPTHGQAIAIWPDPPNVLVEGCCEEFVSSRIQQITGGSQVTSKFFPDLDSPEWDSEKGQPGPWAAEVLAADVRIALAKYAVLQSKLSPAMQATNRENLGTCPKHNSGVRMNINAQNEQSALSGNSTIILTSCCILSMQSQVTQMLLTVGFKEYYEITNARLASDKIN